MTPKEREQQISNAWKGCLTLATLLAVGTALLCAPIIGLIYALTS